MKCCQVECETPFCPHCGKAVDAHGLPTLLKHCRERLAEVERRKYINHSDAARERVCSKWQQWIEALEGALRVQNDQAEDTRRYAVARRYDRPTHTAHESRTIAGEEHGGKHCS